MQRQKMSQSMPTIALENGLDLRKICTTGSTLHINETCEDVSPFEEEREDSRNADYIGKPVQSFESIETILTAVDPDGFVKKKVFEEGGGFPLNEDFTVHIAYTGFWENENEPFDVRKLHKPLVVDLKDSDLLPGLVMAVKSMLVGEVSLFLLSYKVMFGELGVPPRIKPKADCIFYIKLIKSIITPEEGEINFTDPNMFERVNLTVNKLNSSGIILLKCHNTMAAIQLFRKSIFMLHKCRLADEKEEKEQEKWLKKLYFNLAFCYNRVEQPLKACVACNELNRLDDLWNNKKALFQNAKALRMIGQFDAAEKRLLRAQKLSSSKNKQMEEEYNLLQKTRNACDQSKLLFEHVHGPSMELISDTFKEEVDTLIRNFKDNVNLCKLTLPGGLNTVEMKYIKEACIRENLFYNKIEKDFALDKSDEKTDESEPTEENESSGSVESQQSS